MVPLLPPPSQWIFPLACYLTPLLFWGRSVFVAAIGVCMALNASSSCLLIRSCALFLSASPPYRAKLFVTDFALPQTVVHSADLQNKMNVKAWGTSVVPAKDTPILKSRIFIGLALPSSPRVGNPSRLSLGQVSKLAHPIFGSGNHEEMNKSDSSQVQCQAPDIGPDILPKEDSELMSPAHVRCNDRFQIRRLICIEELYVPMKTRQVNPRVLGAKSGPVLGA
ncbi:hypothetical protein FNV43_RR17001 [Rhamnella rubrinervis]|uniref:Uncharacterized protein n=1 Tax=Rhamnella rubrinervis TaxID=2594499 RepID=A0A8K0GZV7_9ROSA|nr:hypothetical protein FNV43_RR17001 [Rhamnella rubrinervis]